jgi:hypothetical protein
MRRRAILLVACMTCTAALPGAVHADAEEASLFVHALSGAGMLGDPAAPGTRTVPLAGTALRFTYATHDVFAYEAELAWSRTAGVAVFEDVMFEGFTGDLERVSYLGRLQAGVRLRLGARYIPTLHLGAGVLAHAAMQSHFVIPDGANGPGASTVVVEGPGFALRWAPMASAGLGFDYRISARWVAGASVSALSTLVPGPGVDDGFQSIEGELHVSYFWYPHW